MFVQAVNSFSAFISNFQFLFCSMVVISVPVIGCHEVSLYLVVGFFALTVCGSAEICGLLLLLGFYDL